MHSMSIRRCCIYKHNSETENLAILYVLPGICLHLTTLQVLAIDYLISYATDGHCILVELYAHGFK